jgi:hypothetical protein
MGKKPQTLLYADDTEWFRNSKTGNWDPEVEHETAPAQPDSEPAAAQSKPAPATISRPDAYDD